MNSAVRRPFRLLLIFAVLAAAWLLFFNQPPQFQVPPKERLRGELELKEERLWSGANPFTGLVIERYEGGLLKSRSAVSNGFLEGLSEGWHTNGVRQVSEHFVKGVSHGVRIKYHPSGQKLSEANIVNGKIEGLFRRWHENGALAEQVQLTNGIAEGESLAFHPDGSLKARVLLTNGVVVQQEFWNPGESP